MTAYKRTAEYDYKIEELLNQFHITSIVKENNIHISGSFVLNVIKDIKTTSDLDLYINIKKFSEKKLGDMILNFILKGYYIKSSNFDRIQLLNNLNKDTIINYDENCKKHLILLKHNIKNLSLIKDDKK